MPHLAELVAKAKAAVEGAQDIAALDLVRVEYLGKKGHLTLQMTSLRELPQKNVQQPVLSLIRPNKKYRKRSMRVKRS